MSELFPVVGQSAPFPVGEWAKNAWSWIQRDLPGPGVFPCNGKIPLTARGCKAASRDLSQINEWGRQYPTANIGLATGGGLVVLDIDAAKDAGDTPGDEWLRDFEREHGELPATLTQTTPNGGAHFFFSANPWTEIRNSAGTLGHNVDVRGHNGYVIVSPSSIDGRRYEGDADVAAAPLPEALAAALMSKTASAANTGEYKAITDEVRTEMPEEQLEALEALERLGGHSAYLRDCVVYITRPGKARGTSATIGYVKPGGEAFEARGSIRCFSSSWPGVKHGWNELADLVALHDGGTSDAATSYLVRDIGEEWRNPTAGGVPTIGRKDDGTGLFYVACVNGVHGGPGSGKSWIAAEIAKQELRRGQNFLWLDLEDSGERVLVERLKMVAVKEEQAERFHYVNGEGEWPTTADVDRLCALIEDKAIRCVVIDSVGEMMATRGLDGNLDPDVTEFLQHVPRRFAAAGAAVVLLDHVTKAGDNKLWPTGSQRKLAGITGAAYLLDTSRPFSRDTAGSARLICAKDRHGAIGRGDEAAWVTFSPAGDGGLLIDIRAADNKTADEKAALALEKNGRKVYELIETADGLGMNELQALAGLGSQPLKAATEWLTRNGLVSVDEGPRSKKIHRVTGEPLPWRTGGAESGGEKKADIEAAVEGIDDEQDIAPEWAVLTEQDIDDEHDLDHVWAVPDDEMPDVGYGLL